MADRLTFDADFYQLPDGTVSAIVRSHNPLSDDSSEVLEHSKRCDPKRVDVFLGERDRNFGAAS